MKCGIIVHIKDRKGSKMSRAVIIASFLDYPLQIADFINEDDYIVCLDGGYDIALKQGIKPQLLLGDFDSLKTELPKDSGIEIMQYPPEKDYTDLELAFRILDPEKYDELLVIGGLGGRLDQTITNVQMLDTYTAGAKAADPVIMSHQFRQIKIMDGRNLCFLIRGGNDANWVIPAVKDCFLSLFSISDECKGLCISGVKYPLENATLKKGISLGVSNEFRADSAQLSLESGTMLVVLAARS